MSPAVVLSLIVSLYEQLVTSQARVAELEARVAELEGA